MVNPDNADTDRVVLEAEGLSRSVRDGDRARTIISDFTFAFHACRIYAVLGPSGAGKSSLLRLFNRLDEPTGGEMRFRGKNTRLYNPCHLRRRIGYLFQTPYLFPVTPRDNLLYAHPDLSSGDMKRLAEQVHLPTEMLDRGVDALSIGERQRIALARLLATEPEVILLDEPTSALDPTNTVAVERLIRDIVGACRVTAIVVTHNPRQALRLAGETLLMVAGRLVEFGPSDRVINSPQTSEGRSYQAGGPQ